MDEGVIRMPNVRVLEDGTRFSVLTVSRELRVYASPKVGTPSSWHDVRITLVAARHEATGEVFFDALQAPKEANHEKNLQDHLTRCHTRTMPVGTVKNPDPPRLFLYSHEALPRLDFHALASFLTHDFLNPSPHDPPVLSQLEKLLAFSFEQGFRGAARVLAQPAHQGIHAAIKVFLDSLDQPTLALMGKHGTNYLHTYNWLASRRASAQERVRREQAFEAYPLMEGIFWGEKGAKPQAYKIVAHAVDRGLPLISALARVFFGPEGIDPSRVQQEEKVITLFRGQPLTLFPPCWEVPHMLPRSPTPSYSNNQDIIRAGRIGSVSRHFLNNLASLPLALMPGRKDWPALIRLYEMRHWPYVISLFGLAPFAREAKGNWQGYADEWEAPLSCTLWPDGRQADPVRGKAPRGEGLVDYMASAMSTLVFPAIFLRILEQRRPKSWGQMSIKEKKDFVQEVKKLLASQTVSLTALTTSLFTQGVTPRQLMRTNLNWQLSKAAHERVVADMTLSRQANIFWAPLFRGYAEKNGVRFSGLSSRRTLRRTYKAVQHCVWQFTLSCVRGVSHIVRVDHPDGKVSTIEYHELGAGGDLKRIQHKGWRNTDVTDPHVLEAVRWLDDALGVAVPIDWKTISRRRRRAATRLVKDGVPTYCMRRMHLERLIDRAWVGLKVLPPCMAFKTAEKFLDWFYAQKPVKAFLEKMAAPHPPSDISARLDNALQRLRREP